MTTTKTYRVGFPFDAVRKKEEAKLFAEGWEIQNIEEKKRRDWGGTCCLAILFFPLAFLPINIKEVTVTYAK
jgi:hypothetical protein